MSITFLRIVGRLLKDTIHDRGTLQTLSNITLKVHQAECIISINCNRIHIKIFLDLNGSPAEADIRKEQFQQHDHHSQQTAQFNDT